jgi:hypothetical protein
VTTLPFAVTALLPSMIVDVVGGDRLDGALAVDLARVMFELAD